MSNLAVALSGSIPDTLHWLLGEDLNFDNSDKRHCAHGWHSFPAKFPPQLPEFFISRLTQPGDVVLDPMMGSGTTLLESVRLGRRAIGCDIDPLALTITKAKLTPIKTAQIVQVGCRLLQAAEQSHNTRRAALRKDLSARFDAGTLAFLDYWFLPETQLELLALIQEIEKLRPMKLQNFFVMIFSSVIIAKTAGVSLARDLAHTRPHKVLGKKPVSAFDEFLKRLSKVVASGTNADLGGGAMLKHKRAQNTGLPSDSVDLVITSPPYANNAIDYMRAHKFSLAWLNHTIKDLSALRSRYLGHDAVGGKQDDAPLPRQCETTAKKLGKLSASKGAALRRYFSEMREVIREMHRVLKPEKPCIIVVGSSVLSGLDVETDRGLAAIGEAEGFELAGIGARRINRDRRMMPARTNGHALTQIENRMHDELIIGLIKR